MYKTYIFIKAQATREETIVNAPETGATPATVTWASGGVNRHIMAGGADTRAFQTGLR